MGEIKNPHGIEEYQFEFFTKREEKSPLKEYQFETLEQSPSEESPQEKEALLPTEQSPQEKSFHIVPIVREYRGMNQRAEIYQKKLIEEEVEKRVSRIEKEAFKKGYAQGLDEGKIRVFEQEGEIVAEKQGLFNDFIRELLNYKNKILTVEKESIYILIRNLVKWVTLKELKGDGEYIYRLLEKLMTELQNKTNILIQVNSKDFSKMPNVLKHMEKHFEGIENVRFEVNDDIEGEGLILSTENEVINASLQEQFQSFERLFSDLGLEEDKMNVAELLRIIEEAKAEGELKAKSDEQ